MALQQQTMTNQGIAMDEADAREVLPARPRVTPPRCGIVVKAKTPLSFLELPATPSPIADRRRIAQAFGAVLKIARMGAQLSQEELGQRAGMVRATVSQYERGLHQPTLRVILRLSAVLGVNAGMLVQMAAGRLLRSKPSGEGDIEL